MAKKNDAFYYDRFIKSAETAYEAAKLLNEQMTHFDPAKIEDSLAAMHEFEQAGDELVHEVDDALISAFITPIEREDISTLINALDTVIDRIEGVLHRIYFTNVQEMRPDALKMADKVVTACEQMLKLVRELPQFKRSKTLRENIITVNTIESDCDEIYIEAMRTLHTTESDALTVISWRDVYAFLEYSADCCEHVADTVEHIVMKNS